MSLGLITTARGGARWRLTAALALTLALLLGALPAPTAAATTTFANPAAITITTGPGGASLYPAEIVVAGLVGTVSKVTATLTGISHTFPGDLDILLVGPNGNSVLLTSDLGVGNDYVNLTLTFDDSATSTLPFGAGATSGTYRPLDNDSTADDAAFPAPAPGGPHGVSFGGAFNGSDPNGTWQLYIFDDLADDGGSVAGGWSVTITTSVVATALSVAPVTGPFGGTATLTATLTAGVTGLSGKTVAFTLNGIAAGSATTNASGVATLPGASLAGIGAGVHPVAVGASFAGDADYDPSAGTGSLTVSPVGQVITFNPDPLPDKVLGDPAFAVTATASSGLPVTFIAAPSEVCGAAGPNGATIVLVGAGTCTVTATQAGDASHPPAAPVARPFTVTLPPVSLTVVVQGPGGVSPGSGNYPPGPLTLTATPQPGALFTGWRVDGQPVGWASTLTLTIGDPRGVVATFATLPAFGDLPANDPAATAVAQLAARGIIKGYGGGRFGPADELLRAQISVQIVRAFGLDDMPTGPPPYTDLAELDPELNRAIALLALEGIAKGYGDGTFGPNDQVTQAQVIAFIARGMVLAGYWQAATQDDPSIYPNVPLSSSHRLDLLTFVQNAGPIPERPPGQAWADWNAPASRGWTARLLWQALNSYFATNHVP